MLDQINPKLKANKYSSSGIPKIKIPEIALKFQTCSTNPGNKAMRVRK